MTPRPVKITISHRGVSTSYLVSYLDRVKFGRYTAAQFDARVKTLDEVKEYISKRPDLKLVEDDSAGHSL